MSRQLQHRDVNETAVNVVLSLGVGAMLTAGAAWITHIVWTISLLTKGTVLAGQVAMMIIGLLFPPVAVIHGIMIWFGVGF